MIRKEARAVTEPPTFSRPARYIWAAVITLLNVAIIGTPLSYGTYHLILWLARTSAEPGQLTFIRDLPGPFTGWLSHALWYWVLFIVAVLPKLMIRAHRNEYYPRPKPKPTTA